MLYLFTDFGISDTYVGQVKSAILLQHRHAHIIDLLHSAPDFNARASAHLLAALTATLTPPTVVLAVVDAGVGSARRPVVVRADGCWYVGPDNGLLSVVTSRAAQAEIYEIRWRPDRLSHSFHGRDLFAPVAAQLDAGEDWRNFLEPSQSLNVELDACDLWEIIYIDHYGNAMTGIRAATINPQQRLLVQGFEIPYARVFSEIENGALFWYENSIGLVELAVNCGSAARKLSLMVGTAVSKLSQQSH